MVFYLKVNRDERYTFRNISNWMNAIYERADEGSTVFFVCDNEKIKKEIEEKCIDASNKGVIVQFIKSLYEDEELTETVKTVVTEEWYRAGVAHLTTFRHAWHNGIKEFWNIDADDTCFCLKKERLAALMKAIEKSAIDNALEVYSLDMHYSRCGGMNWTFGVTFVRTERNWILEIKERCEGNRQYEHYYKLLSEIGVGIDQVFGFLKETKQISIASYYVDNLKFIHYSNDFFKRPISSAMYHWKDGRIYFPILLNCFGMTEKGMIPIANDVLLVKYDIADTEATEFLIENSFDRCTLQQEGSYIWENFFKKAYEMIRL